MIHDLLQLFYPDHCLTCERKLLNHEQELCHTCFHSLPRSHFENQHLNPVMRLFNGRVDLEEAMALYLFRPKTKVEKLIHEFKYRGNKQIAIYLGNCIGEAILKSGRYHDVECVVPVPLHPKKQKKRGYNQASLLGSGIASCLNIPQVQKLKRVLNNESQTNKTAYQRWVNVENNFQLDEAVTFEYSKVLLVDDVVTTGSTIESCVWGLNQKQKVKVSLASLAWAQH